jgi:acyl-CoA thioester hydrolase
MYRSWARCASRYGDLDPNGHVNNGAINAFLEEGRVRFRRDCLAGQPIDVLKGFVVARICVDYLSPLGYPSEVEVGTSVTEIGRTSFRLLQGIFSESRCIATAEVVAVHVDPEDGSALALPPELRKALESRLAAS